MHRISLVYLAFLAACVIPATPPTGAAAPAAPTATPATGTGAAAGAGVAAGSGTAVTSTAPAGWSSQVSDGNTWLTYADSESSVKVAILPAQPLTGSLVDAFQTYWQASFASQVTTAPLPMRARLANGLAVAYDGGTATGTYQYLDLYVVAAGDQAVAVLGVYSGMMGSSLDTAI